MRAGWKLKTLGEVARFINGRAYKQNELLESGPYAVLRVGNFFTNKNWYYSNLELETDKYCDDGDLLYAWSASFGPRIWKGGKVIYHYHIWKVEPDLSVLNKRYLFYFLEWDKELIQEQHGAGTTMVHVTKGAIEKRQIALPSLAEQNRIVTVLDDTFEGLVTTTANAEKNLKNARELFDSYLHSTFMPKGNGWPARRFGEVTEVKSGGTPSRSNKDYWKGDIPWYSSGELNDLYTSNSAEKISKLGLKNSNAKIFPKGSLLIGMYDTAAMKMSIADRDATFNQAIAGAKPNPDVDLTFVLHALLAMKAEILDLRRGIRQKNLSLEKIKNIEIRIPTVRIQKEVVERLMSYRKTVAKLEAIYREKLAIIAELKQSVLQAAFSGELTSPPSSAVKEAAE